MVNVEKFTTIVRFLYIQFFRVMMLAMSVLLLSVQCAHLKLSEFKEICRKVIDTQPISRDPLIQPDRVHELHKEIWALVRVSEFISRDRELEAGVKALKTELSECIRFHKALFTRKSYLLQNRSDCMYTPHEFLLKEELNSTPSGRKGMDVMVCCIDCCIGIWSRRAGSTILERSREVSSEDHIAIQLFCGALSDHMKECEVWLRSIYAFYRNAFYAASRKRYRHKYQYYNNVYDLFERLEKDIHHHFVCTLRFHYSYCVSDLSLRITDCCYAVMLDDKFAEYKSKYSLERGASGPFQVPPEIPAWLRPHMFHAGIVKKAELELLDLIVELHGAGTRTPELAAQVEETLVPKILKEALKGRPDIVFKSVLKRFVEYPSFNKAANRATALVGFQMASLEVIRAMSEGVWDGVTSGSKSACTFYKLYIDNIDSKSESGDTDTAVIVDLSKQVMPILRDLRKKKNMQCDY